MRLGAPSVLTFLLYGAIAHSSPAPTPTSPQCPSSTADQNSCEKQGLGDTGDPECKKWVGSGFTLQYDPNSTHYCHMMNFRGEAGKCYNVEGIWHTCRPALWYNFDGTADCTVWESRDCDSNVGAYESLVDTTNHDWGFGANGNPMTVLSYKCVANAKTQSNQ